MVTMRAKMQVHGVSQHKRPDGSVSQEDLILYAVAKDGAYPSDGSDEDNTFARWSPSGEMKLSVQNPSLFGALPVGARFYVDFTPA